MLLAGIIVFITISLLLFLLSMIWPPDSPWSPWWRTNKKIAEAIITSAKITKDDFIYDLGCGDGTLLITAGKQIRARGVGVEIDPARVLVARLRVLGGKLRGRVVIKRGDLFKENISEASVVVVYLVPKTLRRLENKFRTELREGTRVVSFVYPIEYFPEVASDKKNQVYVYAVAKKSRISSDKKL